MAENSTEYSLKINVEGLGELSNDLKKLKGSKGAVNELVKVIGSLAAVQSMIDDLAKSGLNKTARKVFSGASDAISGLSSIKVPDMERKRDSRGKFIPRTKEEKAFNSEVFVKLSAEFNNVSGSIIEIIKELKALGDEYDRQKARLKEEGSIEKAVREREAEDLRRLKKLGVAEVNKKLPMQKTDFAYTDQTRKDTERYIIGNENSIAVLKQEIDLTLKKIELSKDELEVEKLLSEYYIQRENIVEADRALQREKNTLNIIKQQEVAEKRLFEQRKKESILNVDSARVSPSSENKFKNTNLKLGELDLDERQTSLILNKYEQELVVLTKKLKLKRELYLASQEEAEAEKLLLEYSEMSDQSDTLKQDIFTLKEILEIKKQDIILEKQRRQEELKSISRKYSTKTIDRNAVSKNAATIAGIDSSNENSTKIKELNDFIRREGELLKITKERVLAAKDEAEYKRELSNYEAGLKNIQNMQLELAARKEAVSIIRKQEKAAQEMLNKLAKEKEIREQIKTHISNANKIVKDFMSGGKISRRDLDFKIREINAELSKMPLNVRKVRAEKMADDLRQAGVHTRSLNGNLEVTRVVSSKVESHFAKTVKDMFSMEKLISRISFVITAKMSYEAFDTVVQAIKSAVQINIEFRDEMGKTFALIQSESDATKEKLVQDVAMIARKWRIELTEASDAIYQIVSAMFSASESVIVLDSALKLSRAGFATAEDAALSLVQVLRAFDLGAKDASHIADVFFETTKRGIITVQQMSDEMSKVASTASIFGIPIEEISAAIATMTMNGVNAEQAFTSLNQMLMTIANPTKESEKLMEKYGKNLSISDVRAKGLVNTLLELQPLLSNEEDATTIFKNRNGFKAMASLVQNSDDFSKNLLAMYDSLGSSQKAAEERMLTTGSLIKGLGTEVKELGRSIGEGLEPIVSYMMKTAIGGLKFISKNLSSVFIVFKSLVRAAVAFLAVRYFSKIAAGIRSIFDSLSLMFMYGIDGIKKIIKSFASLRIAITATGAAAKAAWAQATLGISVIVGLIVAATSALAGFIKKSKEANFEKALGVKNAEKTIDSINGKINEINSNLSRIEGLARLAYQADEAFKNMTELERASTKYIRSQQDIADAIGEVIGETINWGTVSGKLSAYNSLLSKRYIEEKENEIRQLIRLQQIEAGKLAVIAMKNTDNDPFSGLRRLVPNINKLVWDEDSLETTETSEFRGVVSTFKELFESMAGVNPESELNRDRVNDSINKLNDLYRRLEAANPESDEFNAKKPQMMEAIVAQINYLNSGKNINMSILGIEPPDFLSFLKDKNSEDSDGDGGGGKNEIKDRVEEFIDKYTDLFRSVGVAVEDKYTDKLNQIKNELNALIGDTSVNIPLETDREMLSALGDFLGSFAEIDEMLKRKTRTVSQANELNSQTVEKLRETQERRNVVESLAQRLRESTVPELQRLGSNLVEIFDKGMEDFALQVTDSLNNNYREALKRAKSLSERNAVYLEILSSDENIMSALMRGNNDEIDKILEDEATTELMKEAIRSELKQKNIRVAAAFRGIVGQYGFLLDELELNLKDISSVFEYIKSVLEPMGVSENEMFRLFDSIVSADPREISDLISGLIQNSDEYIAYERRINPQITRARSRSASLELQRASILTSTTIPEEQKAELVEPLSLEIDELNSEIDRLSSTMSTLLNLRKESLVGALQNMLPDNFDKWTPEAKRKWKYENRKSSAGESGSLIDGELEDVVKKKLGIDEAMTINDAIGAAETSFVDTSTALWGQYWENRINAAEKAKERLIQIEEDKNKIMLANENMSSEQQAILQARLEERKRQIEERENKKISAIKKKQALAEMQIEFAKNIAILWARELGSKGAGIGTLSAIALTALLTTMFGIQRNIIEKSSFADGGYTGSGFGSPDSTGYKRAGIVHEGEIVIDKKTTDRNYVDLMNMYSSLKNGLSFRDFVASYLAGRVSGKPIINSSGMFASGGYASVSRMQSNEPINVTVDFNGMRVLDDVDFSIIVEQGNRKRRVIRG